jgi:hypothetical protein
MIDGRPADRWFADYSAWCAHNKGMNHDQRRALLLITDNCQLTTFLPPHPPSNIFDLTGIFADNLNLLIINNL